MSSLNYVYGWLKTGIGKTRFAPLTTAKQVLMTDGRSLHKYLTKAASLKEVKLPADGWSSDAPYTQTVALEGVMSSDRPDVYLNYPDSIDESNAEAYVEAYGYINKVETVDNALIVTAFYEKPAMDITLTIKGV